MFLYGLLLLGGLVAFSNSQASPCPNLFQYVSHKPGSWDGELTLLSDADLHGIWVRLIFDTASLQLDVPESVGTTTTTDHLEYLLKNREYRLRGGEPLKVKITVKYEGEKAPKLIGFRLNARTVCPEHKGEFNWVDSTSGQNSNEFFLGDLNNKDFLSSRPVPAAVTGCGVAPLYTGDLLKARKTGEGQWPWHASIYLTKGNQQKSICAATLISPTLLLTAAHCVAPKNSESVLHADTLKIHLGEHFAKSKNEGLQEAHVIAVIPHPGYNAINFDNDVAIIKLDKAVTITDYVRPVCLWEESADLQSVLRREGVVVGVGFDTEGRYSDRLTQGNLKVITSDVCLSSKPELAPFLSEKGFCAAYTKGNTICVGESGSGYTFLSQGPKPVWQLRALMTVGAGLQNKLVCDDTNYVVLTDLAKHSQWIKAFLV